MSSTGSNSAMPALLTNPSNSPACRTHASTSSIRDTSAAIQLMPPAGASPAHASAAAASLAALRDTPTTCAPSMRSRRSTASPMP